MLAYVMSSIAAACKATFFAAIETTTTPALPEAKATTATAQATHAVAQPVLSAPSRRERKAAEHEKKRIAAAQESERRRDYLVLRTLEANTLQPGSAPDTRGGRRAVLRFTHTMGGMREQTIQRAIAQSGQQAAFPPENVAAFLASRH